MKIAHNQESNYFNHNIVTNNNNNNSNDNNDNDNNYNKI